MSYFPTRGALGDDNGLSVKQYGSYWTSYQSPTTLAFLQGLQRVVNVFPGISVKVDGLIGQATADAIKKIARGFLYNTAGTRMDLIGKNTPASLAGSNAQSVLLTIGAGSDGSGAAQPALVAQNAITLTGVLAGLSAQLAYFNAKPTTAKPIATPGGAVATYPSGSPPPGPGAYVPPPPGGMFASLTHNKMALAGVVVLGGFLIGRELKKGKRGGKASKTSSRRRA